MSDEKGTSMTPEAIKLTLKSLYAHCAINMSVSMLTFSTRSELLLPLVGGDYNRVAVYMSGWTAATAALEFLVNPTIGKLSDAFGRRIFLLIAPVANIILKTWVLLNPTIVSLTVERLICDGLRTLGGSTMGLAMLSDLLPQDQFAQGAATLVSFMGIVSTHDTPPHLDSQGCSTLRELVWNLFRASSPPRSSHRASLRWAPTSSRSRGRACSWWATCCCSRSLSRRSNYRTKPPPQLDCRRNSERLLVIKGTASRTGRLPTRSPSVSSHATPRHN